MVDALALGDLTAHEVAVAAGVPMNLASHHLRALEAVGLVERRVSEGDRRRRYVVLRRDALNGLLLPQAALAPAGLVLFVCTHNSARSQFAAALWRLANRERRGQRRERAEREGSSAGCTLGGPQRCRSPRCRSSRGTARFGVEPAFVVSVCDCAREAGIPFAAPAVHWSVPDPVRTGGAAAFASAFAEISDRIESLAAAGAATGSRSAPHDERPAPHRHQRLRAHGPPRPAGRLGASRPAVRPHQRDRRRRRDAALSAEFDSVHGRWDSESRAAGAIADQRRSVSFSSERRRATCLGRAGVDIVLECSGKFRTPETLEPYFDPA